MSRVENSFIIISYYVFSIIVGVKEFKRVHRLFRRRRSTVLLLDKIYFFYTLDLYRSKAIFPIINAITFQEWRTQYWATFHQ